jgi:hypothetical protein
LYWPLALAVTINATKNRFTTASIDLLCTSGEVEVQASRASLASAGIAATQEGVVILGGTAEDAGEVVGGGGGGE